MAGRVNPILSNHLSYLTQVTGIYIPEYPARQIICSPVKAESYDKIMKHWAWKYKQTEEELYNPVKAESDLM